MKKITFILLLTTSLLIKAQTYTSGDVILSDTPDLEMQAKLDITETEVTLTFYGPADRWFAIGFGGSTMGGVTDAFLYDGTGDFDKKIDPYATPITDTTQDWTIISDTVTGLQREVIAIRDLDTGENFDYVFTHSDTTIPVIWSRSETASNELLYHGGNNRGTTTLNFSVLGEENFKSIKFAMYPNPVKNTLNIVLPSNIEKPKVEIYSVLGKIIQSKYLKESFNEINVSNLNSGIYLLKIMSENNSYSVKQFIKK